MDIIKSIELYTPYIIIGMAVVVVLLLILVLIQARSLMILKDKYRRMMKGTNGKNLEEVIMNNLDKIEECSEKTRVLKKEFKLLNEKSESCIQKVAVTRYRAFEDVGSNLSFSIALLDNKNDGLVLTGIFGRNESTTYAKPIDKGISRYDLSEEELNVLNEAINK